MTKPFELIYEGPIDDTSDTLRKVKAVFLAELNFSIEKTKEILEKAPLTVIRADEEIKITRYAQLLSTAGARVHIVVPEKSSEFDDDDLLDIDISFEEPKKKQKVYSLTDDSVLEEFEEEENEEDTDDSYDISEIDESLLQLGDLISGTSEKIGTQSSSSLQLQKEASIVEELKAQADVEPEDEDIYDLTAEPVSEDTPPPLPEETKNISPITLVEPTFEITLEKTIKPEETESSLIKKMEEAEGKNLISTDFTFNDDPLADRFTIPEEDSIAKKPSMPSSGFDLSFNDESEVVVNKQEEKPSLPKPTTFDASWELSLGATTESLPQKIQVSTKPVTPPSELDALFNSYEAEDEKKSDDSFNFKEHKKEQPKELIFVEEVSPVQEVFVPEKVREIDPPIREEGLVPKTKKKKRSFSLTPIICTLGILVLWGLNHLYFSLTVVEESQVEPIVIKAKKNSSVLGVSETIPFTKSSVKDGIELQASGEIEKGILKNISVTVKNTLPGSLKVDKLVFENIPVENLEDGKFSLHGPVRITVLEGKQASRVIGTGVVNGRVNNDAVSISLEAKYQADSTEKMPMYLKKNGSGFSISFSTSQVLR